MADLLAPLGQALLVCTAVPRRRNDDHAGEFVLAEVAREPFGVHPVIGMCRPRHGYDFLVAPFERVGQLRRQQVCIIGSVDQQPFSGLLIGRRGQRLGLPLDGQQAFAEQPIAVAALRRSGAHLQPARGQQDRAVRVDHVEVGVQTGMRTR